jgi:hypothetical protein
LKDLGELAGIDQTGEDRVMLLMPASRTMSPSEHQK